MKKYFKSIFTGTVVIVIAGMLTFALACKKESVNQENASALTGQWKLQDYMQVNSEDGRPDGGNNAPLNVSEVVFEINGNIGMPEDNAGKWDMHSGLLNLDLQKNGQVSAKVEFLDKTKLVLSQAYPATGGEASGINYYTFAR